MNNDPERQPKRVPWRQVDGVLLLDKPGGLSSSAALQRVRRLYRADKAGHTGTLDPLASGLLPICFGEATKFAHALLEADKAYVATVRLGSTTTTGDAEGSVIAERPVRVARADIDAALPRFVGPIAQVPPRHAALKFKGRNYYEYARAGIDIPRAARQVVVHELAVVAWSPPDIELYLRCGKGTYVRALAEDLGEVLGCGAHLSALRRVASGSFGVDAALPLATLAGLDAGALDARLLPIDALLDAMPRLDLAAAEGWRLGRGQAIARSDLADGDYRAYADDAFLGVVRSTARVVRPRRLRAAADAGNASRSD